VILDKNPIAHVDLEEPGLKIFGAPIAKLV